MKKEKAMKIGEARERLAAVIAAKDRPALHGVLVMNGNAYASDAIYAVRIPVDPEPQGVGDCVPVGFPVERMMKIFAELDAAVLGCTWFRFNGKVLAERIGQADKKMIKEQEEHRRNYRERYETYTCPCCGDVVYFDKDYNCLVEDMDKYEEYPTELRDVRDPVLLAFGDGGKCFVNFARVAMLVREFGEDMMFAAVEYESRQCLAFKTANGLTGILQPMLPPSTGIEKILVCMAAEGGAE